MPQNAEIVKVNGEKAKNKTVKLELGIPAGQEIALTFTVKPTAGVGSRIVCEGGYVHAIPLPKITTGVQKTSFDTETVRAAIAGANGKEGADFANAVWQAITPDAPAIPDYETLRKELFDRKSIGDYKPLLMKKDADLSETGKLLRNMWVEEYYGGQLLSPMGNNRRVLELRYRDLKAGDVVISAANAVLDSVYGVFDGEAVITAENGANRTLLELQFQKLLKDEFFIVLRPAQAM